MEQLLPCPFCGSADISEGEVLTTRGAGGTATQSMCNECGALGPEAKLPEGEVDYGDVRATAAWNKRALPVQDKDAERWKTAKRLCGIYGGWWQIQIRTNGLPAEITAEQLEAAFESAIDAAALQGVKGEKE